MDTDVTQHPPSPKPQNHPNKLPSSKIPTTELWEKDLCAQKTFRIWFFSLINLSSSILTLCNPCCEDSASRSTPPSWRMSQCLFSARFLQSAACLAEWMAPGYCISQWYLWFYTHLQDVISGSKPQTEQDLQGNTKLCSACAPGSLQITLASNTNLFFSPAQTP